MPKGEKRKTVTEKELEVLEVLWAGRGQTIRDIADVLYPRGTAGEYATVQKLLDRLEAKGCVRRIRRAPAHHFRARVKREDLIGGGLEDLADRLCAGSWTPLVAHLTKRVKLSAEDRALIREWIDELE